MKTLVVGIGLGLCIASASCSESSSSKSGGLGGSGEIAAGGNTQATARGGASAGGAAGAAMANSGGASNSSGGQPASSGGASAQGGASAGSAGQAVSQGGREPNVGAGGTVASTGGTNAMGGTVANAGGTNATGGAAGAAARTPSLLVFSRTVAYRHDSIPAGIKALQMLGKQRGWTVAASEDATLFSDSGLSAFNVLVFLSTTGDVLDDTQQGAMQRFIQSGKGYVGIHSASDTEYDWAWYGELVGAYFKVHPAIQSASVVVEDKTHPATAMLPSPWVRTDEWYAFRANPRPNVQVLLRLDESSYAPADASMGSDHPIAWAHEYDGGRAFYTALGHTDASYQEPQFLQHLTGAIEWAAQ